MADRCSLIPDRDEDRDEQERGPAEMATARGPCICCSTAGKHKAGENGDCGAQGRWLGVCKSEQCRAASRPICAADHKVCREQALVGVRRDLDCWGDFGDAQDALKHRNRDDQDASDGPEVGYFYSTYSSVWFLT